MIIFFNEVFDGEVEWNIWEEYIVNIERLDDIVNGYLILFWYMYWYNNLIYLVNDCDYIIKFWCLFVKLVVIIIKSRGNVF